MNIETPADAFAALAVLVLGADRVGTFEERRFLFERLAGHRVFQDLDREAFGTFITETTDRVCDAFPTDGMRVTEEGVSEAVELIADVLGPELRDEAFRMAVDLARIDGMVLSEETVLERVQEGLGIDPEVAGELLERDR